MTTVLPNMGLVLPTRGAAGAGLWGDTDDANLAIEDAHDHTSGKGARITTAALDINADLSFSSLYAPTALHRVTFASVAALSSNNKSLFVSSADNELYWRSNAGANVKVTAGSSLNVAAFTGGIGGDYTAVAAALNYDDANKRYTFKQGGGSNWARLAAGGIRLIEFGTNETVYVEHLAPAALGASYSITWPTAVPSAATSKLLAIDSTGQVALMPTLLPSAATSKLLAIDSTGQVALMPASLGAITKPIYITSAGVATAGITGAVFHISPIVGSGAGWAWDATNGYLLSSGAGTWAIGIPTVVGWQIKSLTFELWGDGAADLSGGVNLRHKNSTPGAVGTALASTNPPAAWNDLTVSTINTTIVDGDSLWVNFTANAANLRIGEIRVTYDW